MEFLEEQGAVMKKDRSEYLKKYRADHREELAKYRHSYYEDHKETALTYQENYYILNSEMLLAKAKKRNSSKSGHTGSIYRPVKKYAKQWALPISSWNEFNNWSMNDAEYEEVYRAWEQSGFDKNLSPVVIRTIKKNGFVVGNLTWKVKGDFGWWSEERILRDEMEDELNKEQRVKNKGDDAWKEEAKRQAKEWRKRKKEKQK